MNAHEFVEKWRKVELRERQACQEHFVDTEPPTYLALAHKKLDAAVFAAYGWNPSMSDEQLLESLLALNVQRSAPDEASK